MNGKEEVWNRVEGFRQEHLAGSLQHLPVDVFSLTELRLGLKVISFDDLFAKYDSDAAITQDPTAIYPVNMNNKGAKTRSGRAFPAKPPWHPKPAGAEASRRLGRFAVFSVSALQLLPFVPFLLSTYCFLLSAFSHVVLLSVVP
jgi:hypothetical protein